MRSSHRPGNVATLLQNTNAIVAALAERVDETDRQVAETNKQVAALAERLRETDDRLNTLISAVERHIANHK